MTRKIHVEHAAYLVAFVLALALRMFALGRLPLSDSEAQVSLQALEASRGAGLNGGQPFFGVATAFIFFLFGSGEFQARFWPALIGALVVFAPFLFRNFLNRPAAMLTAFLLAFEPQLLGISRFAGSDGIAPVFLLLACGSFVVGKFVLAGILFALAILSGPNIWLGMIVLAIAAVWFFLSTRKSTGEGGAQRLETNFIRGGLPIFAYWFAGSLVIVGSGLFQIPSALSAIGTSLVEFVHGWAMMAQLTVGQALAFFAVYSPLLVALTLAALILLLVKPDWVDGVLARWWLVALLLILVYPGRQPGGTAWVVLPMCALSARLVVRWFSLLREGWKLSLGQAGLICLVLFSILLNILWFTNPYQAGDVNAQIRFVAIAGGILILLLISVLFAATWSFQTGLHGLGMGMGIFLIVYTISAGWSAAGLGRNPNAELNRVSYFVREGELLESSMDDLSEWDNGAHQNLEVVVRGVSSPALKWLLRNWSQARFTEFMPPESIPSILITPQGETLSAVVAYSGQDFTLREKPVWSAATSYEKMRWLFFREIPVEQQVVTLWVRTDLFPGTGLVPGLP